MSDVAASVTVENAFLWDGSDFCPKCRHNFAQPLGRVLLTVGAVVVRAEVAHGGSVRIWPEIRDRRIEHEIRQEARRAVMRKLTEQVSKQIECERTVLARLLEAAAE